MTREEAKRILQKLCYNSFWFESLSLSEKLALKMSINALSAPKSENKKSLCDKCSYYKKEDSCKICPTYKKGVKK